jgi:hypothetical protein
MQSQREGGEGKAVDVTDAAARMSDGVLKPALKRTEWRRVTQVPFSKVRTAVAVGAQGGGQRPLVLPEQRPTANGVPDPCGVAEVAREQARASGRASGADVEVGEADGLGVELVDVGGLDDGVAVAAELAVALIVRLRATEWARCCQDANRTRRRVAGVWGCAVLLRTRTKQMFGRRGAEVPAFAGAGATAAQGETPVAAVGLLPPRAATVRANRRLVASAVWAGMTLGSVSRAGGCGAELAAN